MTLCERDGGSAGDEVAPDRDKRSDTGLACSLDRRLAVGIIASVVEMRVGINEHEDLRPAEIRG
jgi:hypothetical protein